MDISHAPLGDIATWVGSLGTIAAFIIAFAQIHRERVERQRREWREWMTAKRMHADHISAWIAEETIIVTNQSHHPIHAVTVSYGDGLTAEFEHIPPGRTTTSAPGAESGAAATVEFVDVRGDAWIRAAGHPPVLMQQHPAHGPEPRVGAPAAHEQPPRVAESAAAAEFV